MILNPMTSCAVCLSDKSLEHAITCAKCEAKVHQKCVHEHLLNTVLDAHCPGCLQQWPHEYLSLHLRKDWLLGPYKLHRENILLDREKSLIPDTQELAATELRRRKCKEIRRQLTAERPVARFQKAEAVAAIAELKRIHKKKVKDLPEHDALVIKLAELERRDHEIQRTIKAIDHQRYDPDAQVILENRLDTHVAPAPVRREFIRPCPAPDCRGFLSTAWKCKICGMNTCAQCGDLKPVEAQHLCNPDTQASFQMIKQESKPCPKCGVPITKISGCDHMFCVDCKTSFSWRTGEIHPNGNSNPLYWQWARTTGRVEQRLGDECGHHTILMRVERYLNGNRSDMIMVLASRLPHLIQHSAQQFRQDLNSEHLRDLRVKFILGDIEEDDWKVKIQREEKKRRKAQFVLDVLTLFTQGCLDILGRTPMDSVAGIEEEVGRLRAICNTEFDRINLIFGSTVYTISIDFSFGDKSVSEKRGDRLGSEAQWLRDLRLPGARRRRSSSESSW